MMLSKDAINQVTNIMGAIAGVPELTIGIPMILSGDYIGGGLLTVKGLALMIGFFFIGK